MRNADKHSNLGYQERAGRGIRGTGLEDTGKIQIQGRGKAGCSLFFVRCH